MTRSKLITLGFVLVLAGCGGGNSGNIRNDAPSAIPDTPIPDTPMPTEEEASTDDFSPYLLLEHASHSPILEDESIGVPVFPPIAELTRVAQHETSASHTGWMPVATGVVADGIPKAELTSYLSADIVASGGTLDRFVFPPVIHMTSGATDQDIDATVRAVQMINASLPDAWQISVSSAPKSADVRQAGLGEILMVFANQNQCGEAHALACADVQASVSRPGVTNGATIFAERQTQQDDPMYATWIAHELLHTLGRKHADPQRFPQSLMVPEENLDLAAKILDTLDRDALLAPSVSTTQP